MAVLERIYRYGSASRLLETEGGQTLRLVSETDAKHTSSLRFLAARALYPSITARSLRAVSEIVGSRFYVPPSMLARILREADPVATVTPNTVRFEGFSTCCSTYIRLDLGEAALATVERRSGTTNVEFGAELRGALAKVGNDNSLELTIGPDSVTIVRDGSEIVEKKVPLPIRWIKGFAQVQVHLAGMEPAFSLSRIAAQRFFRQLPRGKSDHSQWISATGGVARSTTRKTAEGVPLRGAHRLRVLESLAPLATSMDVHVNRETGASAWILDFENQRVCMVLNAEPWRGFSGDGGLLTQISKSDGRATSEILARLNWQDRIDLAGLIEMTGMSKTAVECGLAELAATGLLGFDLESGCYFHRVLPFDMKNVTALSPRLKAAASLVDKAAVRLGDAFSEVASDGATHRVIAGDSGYRCTCPWFAKHAGARGPCKHVLAVEMHLEQQK